MLTNSSPRGAARSRDGGSPPALLRSATWERRHPTRSRAAHVPGRSSSSFSRSPRSPPFPPCWPRAWRTRRRSRSAMPRAPRTIRTSRITRRSRTTATSRAATWITPTTSSRRTPTSNGVISSRAQLATDGQAIWQNGCKTIEPPEPPEPPVEGSITVIKNLVPTDDPGRFDLKIDGEDAASGVGDGGTTTIAVRAGNYVVSESAAPGTSLDDYEVDDRVHGERASRGERAIGPSRRDSGRRRSSARSRTRRSRSRAGTVTPMLECVALQATEHPTSRTGATRTRTTTAVDDPDRR